MAAEKKSPRKSARKTAQHKRGRRVSAKRRRDWGYRFGEEMDQRGKEFAEEIEQFGGRVGRRFERSAREWERERHYSWSRTFGVMGPLIGSVFGIVCLALGILFLNLVNLALGSIFISAVSGFLFANLGWFFIIFLFFGYSDYLRKLYPREYWMVSPVIAGAGVVVALWIIAWILNSINISLGSSLIASVVNFLYINLFAIFIIIVVLGYIFAVAAKVFDSGWRRL
ncbi:Uncharacterised protein [uncultured archaeon]|nr:Uncharacterised protein [uncultured archaeon]